MFENTIDFRDTKKLIREIFRPLCPVCLAIAEKVAFPAFDGIFWAETETGEYSRITRWPTRDLCECSPNHECMLNSAIHRQFLRSNVVQNLLRTLANSQAKLSIPDADLKRLFQVVKDSRVSQFQSYLTL